MLVVNISIIWNSGKFLASLFFFQLENWTKHEISRKQWASVFVERKTIIITYNQLNSKIATAWTTRNKYQFKRLNTFNNLSRKLKLSNSYCRTKYIYLYSSIYNTSACSTDPNNSLRCLCLYCKSALRLCRKPHARLG